MIAATVESSVILGIRLALRQQFRRVGLPEDSPHRFRHGHAVYALTHSEDVADLKAVSLNLMHTNLSVTDGVYGVLSKMDVQEHIAALGARAGRGREVSQDALIPLLEQLLVELKNGRKG